MIRNALTGEPKPDPDPKPKTLPQQESDFTAEGAPPPVRGPQPAVPQPKDGPSRAPSSHSPHAALADGAWHGPSVEMDDWDALFGAVKARLRQAVGDTLPHELNGATAPLQNSVLECVDALDQLHATLRRALAAGAPSPWRFGPSADFTAGHASREAVTTNAGDPAARALP